MVPRDPSTGAQETRRFRDSRLLRFAEVAALVLGIVLIGVYLGARIHSHLSSENAVEQFNRARVAVSRLETEFSDPGAVASSPVDTSLWAEGRIEAYQQSLIADMDLPLAVLRIPVINLEVPVFEGTDELVLNRGAGHIEGTPALGSTGNFGVAGHRDGFFRELGDVGLGNEISVDLLDGSLRYLVSEIHIVEPTDVWVLEPTETPSITLVTCFPFYFVGSAPQRYIVRAVLDESGTSTIN